MRIVKMKEFLQLPEGTIFSFFMHHHSTGLYRFCGACGENDFNYASVIGTEDLEAVSSEEHFDAIGKAKEDSSIELPMSGATNTERRGTRDKYISDTDRFLVYSDEDVRGMVQALQHSFVM